MIGGESRRGTGLLLAFFIAGLSLSARSYRGCGNADLHTVRGWSMTPLLRDGDVVCVNTGAYGDASPRPGDIVAVRLRTLPSPLVKRVAAVPDDEVRFLGDHLVINGREEGPRVPRASPLRIQIGGNDGRVPGDSYIILSTARADTLDSRRFGLVSRGQILGSVTLVRKGGA